jgi:hypothetical protein
MRRIIIVALSVALLTTTAWVVRGAAAGSTAQTTRSAAATAPATSVQPAQREALYQSELEQSLLHQHPAAAPSGGGGRGQVLASQLARARLATAKYATNLRAAKAAGYQIITRMIPDMGYHYLNPTIQGFDVTKPPSWSTSATDAAGSSARSSGSSPPSRPPRRCRARPTGRSRRRATTRTGRSRPPPPRTSAPGAAPRPAPPSTSGTRTW